MSSRIELPETSESISFTGALEPGFEEMLRFSATYITTFGERLELPDETAAVVYAALKSALVRAGKLPSNAAGRELCTYPRCNCPFDAPADPAWCARGLPKLPSNAALSGGGTGDNQNSGWNSPPST